MAKKKLQPAAGPGQSMPEQERAAAPESPDSAQAIRVAAGEKAAVACGARVRMVRGPAQIIIREE